MRSSKKNADTNAVGRQRRIFSSNAVAARSFVADFAKASSAAEIAARLYNNKHPKPLEYLLELWRDHHIALPTSTVIDVVRAYDNMLQAARAGGLR